MKLFDDDRLMLAMSFQTKYLGMSPFNCPSLFTMLAFLEYEYGIFHPLGGLGSVSERMAAIAKDLGVTFRMNEAVESVIMDGKTITGVRTEKGEFMADRVVMNADFANGMTQLFPDKVRKKWSNKKLDGKKYSCSTFMLYLGVDPNVRRSPSSPNLRFRHLRRQPRRPRETPSHHVGRPVSVRPKRLRDRPEPRPGRVFNRLRPRSCVTRS